MKSRFLILLVSLFLVANVASGATITVSKDGAGDYSVIQQALDAAADGDTILIGPGEYTETTTIYPPGWPGALEVYGEIRQQRLTIVGAGADVTIIGPPLYAPNYGTESPEGLACDGPKDEIVVADLTVRNCYMGMSFSNSLLMERCHLDNNLNGVFWTARGSGGTMRDCRFSTSTVLQPLGLYVRGVGGVVVENCEFLSAHPYVDNAGAVFRNCSSIGPGVVGFYSASGVCELWSCSISGVEVGLSTGYIGSRCEIHESDIQGSFCSLLVEHRTSALVESCTLAGGSDSVALLRDSESIALNGCDFQRGTGPIIRVSRQCILGSATYDLTNNYWGTANETEIQAWIIDSNDDSNICATVLYSPFAGQSLPTESTSWGDLKALWR